MELEPLHLWPRKERGLVGNALDMGRLVLGSFAIIAGVGLTGAAIFFLVEVPIRFFLRWIAQ